MPINRIRDRTKQQELFEVCYPQTISQRLTQLNSPRGSLVQDDNKVVWKVEHLKKGYDLTAQNIPAHISNWTCFKIGLINLQPFDANSAYPLPSVINTAQSILLNSEVEDGDHYIDRAGVVWYAKVKSWRDTFGQTEFEIQAAFHNAFLNWTTLAAINLPGLKKISTKAQREDPKFNVTHPIYR